MASGSDINNLPEIRGASCRQTHHQEYLAVAIHDTCRDYAEHFPVGFIRLTHELI